ncbi:MAG: carboxylating nicotinate-nucleotide diphosphorylase [bacterium]|nr:carboxylating nicotinate-nucleotide diphosphorylase [bacterium]
MKPNSGDSAVNQRAETDRPHYTSPVGNIIRADCEDLLRAALIEDAPPGWPTADPTTEAIFAAEERARARLIPRESGVLCGVPVIRILNEIFGEMQSDAQQALQIETRKADGDAFAPGEVLLELEGPLRALLRLERPILNFLQYLSGIATTTAETVRLAGPEVAVLDTRKTLPGYRRLAKYAVYCGGGTNHRIHLSDMAMIKDNHVAAAGGVTAAVNAVRRHNPDLPLNVEVDTLEQLAEVLPLEPDVILLDNMRRERIEQALAQVKAYQEGGGRAPFIELSGGWKPDELGQLKGLGRLGVSMGFLTHTTRFLDLSLDIAST